MSYDNWKTLPPEYWENDNFIDDDDDDDDNDDFYLEIDYDEDYECDRAMNEAGL
jgi:hypothetical protein